MKVRELEAHAEAQGAQVRALAKLIKNPANINWGRVAKQAHLMGTM
jgi:hypothetical protein